MSDLYSVTSFQKIRALICSELETTLNSIEPAQVYSLLDAISASEKVFFVGVGRVLLSLQAIAKRLANLGLKTVIVGQITEPAITENDLLVVGSGSGESLFPLGIARKAKQFSARVAHIGSNSASSMQQFTEIFVIIPVSTKLNIEGEIVSEQPMTSLFEQSLLLLGDSIALILIRQEGIELGNL